MSIQLKRHPAERGRRTFVVACGTCCCCCCLHSLGGFVGAAAATATVADKHVGAVKTYWITFAIVNLVFFLLTLGAWGVDGGLLALALALPAVQLLTSVLSALVLSVSGNGGGCIFIGKITVWALAGAIVGSVGLVLLLGLIN